MTVANSANTEAKVAKYNKSFIAVLQVTHRSALRVDLVQVNSRRIEDDASGHDCP